jgi:hypothetical protein
VQRTCVQKACLSRPDMLIVPQLSPEAERA